MHPLSLIALPGFFGRKEDWQDFCFDVETFLPIDLMASPSMNDFAKELNAYAKTLAPPRVLMGYSLGARLALHALVTEPNVWQKAILVSPHPGLVIGEREARKNHDSAWANEFLHSTWDVVSTKWEAQAVFKTCQHRFQRAEQDYSRSHLAHCLTHYSLGCQEDLREPIAKLDLPIMWITGQYDEKFTTLANTISLNSHSQKVILPCGHRVPWEKKEDFQKVVYSFLKSG